MRLLIKILFLAALIYGGWWFWNNYEVKDWYQNCKNHPNSRTTVCFQMPLKKGAVSEMRIYLTKDCTISEQTVGINRGNKVVWYNDDVIDHIVSGDNYYLVINPGRYVSRVFNEPGSYDYTYCGEGGNSPRGTIIVN